MKNFLFALRYLRKLRGGTLARVVSLSLGLAVGLLVFSYANYNLTSDRCFPDRERIFQLWAHYADPQHSGYSPQLNAPIAPALAEEVPQVEAATRLFGAQTSDIVRGDNAFQAKYIYADTMFFDVLGFEPMNGNPKEILLHADQVMLAESFARTVFGRKDPVGQLVLLNGTDSLTVMGLFRDPNPNQHLGSFNMLCSFELVKRDLNTSWRRFVPELCQTPQGGVRRRDRSAASRIFRPPRIDRGHESLEPQLPVFPDHGIFAYKYFCRLDRLGVNGAGGPYAFRCGDELCADFDFDVSQPLEDHRHAQSRGCPAFGHLPHFLFRNRRTDLRFGRRGRIPVVGLAGTGAGDYRDADVRTLRPEAYLGAVARHPRRICPRSAYPFAYFHLGSRDIGVPRGQRQPPPVETDAAGGRDRQCTFTLTLLLLAVLQFDKLRNGDFGFEHDRIVYTYVKTPLGNISSVCDAVASLPEVDAAGASLEVPLWGYSGMPCIDENSKELLFSCRWLLCNEGFIPAMRMHLVGGRNFTPSSNPLEAIVNETYVRMRGWTPEQALGHQITDDSSPGAPLYTIVGVVKDFRTVVATGEVEPIVFHPFSYFQKFGATDDYMLDYFLMIRLRGMSPESLEAVQRKIGEYPSGNNHTLEVYDNKLGPILFEIRSFRNIVFTVSGITLLIALMGLVGYLGDEMRRRSKEIALRKVNGASTADVLRLLARDVLWIAVPSVVVGAAVSRWGADLLVSNFVERVALRWWLFALCGAVVLLIVCTVQLVRTWRIANANPINMIKTE